MMSEWGLNFIRKFLHFANSDNFNAYPLSDKTEEDLGVISDADAQFPANLCPSSVTSALIKA